jgi:hypothetical protein
MNLEKSPLSKLVLGPVVRQAQGQAEGQAGGISQGQALVDLTNKMNWQQTNIEHRYKYTGDNVDGRPLLGSGDNPKDW